MQKRKCPNQLDRTLNQLYIASSLAQSLCNVQPPLQRVAVLMTFLSWGLRKTGRKETVQLVCVRADSLVIRQIQGTARDSAFYSAATQLIVLVHRSI